MSGSEDEQPLLEFQYSFGYDCQRLYNLCVCDENIIAWASGSVLTFFNVIEKQRYFHYSQTGGNIGHITKTSTTSPNNIAVAYGKSNNCSAMIEIYEWPSMKSLHQLKNGNENSYIRLNYSYDGKLLASLSDAPDYSLTVWDWENNCIKLKAPAFSQDVFNVQFSPYVSNQLITCGSDHIKFWKMAVTPTGLKLKGVLGRFGNTDICDILGIVPLPDEKILSSCSWGNILVWEQNVIKFEILRKGRRPCHSAPITQILYCPQSDEITTVSMDGHICTWYWKTIDPLDIDENDPFEEINPISEIIVPDSQLISINHRRNNEWFAQDASGAIWEINMEVDNESGIAKEIQYCNGEKIVLCHGAAVVGIIPLKSAPFLISLGLDGSLFIHKIPFGPVLTMGKYKFNASCILQIPLKIDKYERTLVIGFQNGIIKLLLLNLKKLSDFESSACFDECFILLQFLKPHTKLITAMSVNEKNNILMTASEDHTIFVYKIKNTNDVLSLSPLYFINTPNIIWSIDWKPSDCEIVLLAGSNGILLEAKLPNIDDVPIIDNITTFKKEFISVSHTKLKNLCLKEINQQFTENLNLTALEDEISHMIGKSELVELDECTRKILWAKYDPNDDMQIWAAQEFCNCILRLKPSEKKINKYVILNGKSDESITSHLYINENDHFITGQSNGEIAVYKMPSKDEDQSESLHEKLLQVLNTHPKKHKKSEPKTILVPKIILNPLEKLKMHCYQTGKITNMSLNADLTYLYTAGEDGNIFSLKFNSRKLEKKPFQTKKDFFSILNIPDYQNNSIAENWEILSHEEFIQEKEKDTLKISISSHIQKLQTKLEILKAEVREIIELNSTLPQRQQIHIEEHISIQNNILSKMNEKMHLVKRKLAYPLEVSNLRLKKMIQHYIDPLEMFPFQLNSVLDENNHLKIIRQKKLPPTFFDDFELVNSYILKYEEDKEPQGLFVTPRISMESKERRKSNIDTRNTLSSYSTSIMKNLPSSPPPSHILTKALRSYLQRLDRQRLQEISWQEHLEKYKPNQTDLKEVYQETSSGEYCLKSQLKSISHTSKYNTIHKMFCCRKEIYDLQHKFNSEITSLRTEKKQLVKTYEEFKEKINKITSLLPQNLIKPTLFPAPAINFDAEYPEEKLKISSEIFDQSNNSKYDTTDEAYNTKYNENFVDNQINSPEHHERIISNLLSEQDNLILNMKMSIDEWEKSYKIAKASRERILLQSQFLRLHLLYLTQEKLILESFESQEKQLSVKVIETQQKLESAYHQLSVYEEEVENKNFLVASIIQQQKDLSIRLSKIITNSQYSLFLKRIYNKKSKSTESSNSSSSTSSETEDFSSINGQETSRVRLDSSSCPPGCDPQIFEETIELRSIRCKYDNEIKDHKKQISTINSLIFEENNVISKLKNELEVRQNDLRNLIHEKQSQLNNIDTVVVLKSSQCRIDAFEKLKPGEGTLIFPASVKQNLKSKIQQLLKEAEEQRKIYELMTKNTHYNMSKTHLHRIQADCDFMNNQISNLQDKIQHILQQKLGLTNKMSNLNYESVKKEASKILDGVLESMINQFRVTTTSGLTKDMENQLTRWKKRQYDLEQQYCSAIQDYTTKLRTAATLYTESISSKDAEKSNPIFGSHLVDEYKKDINRLKQIQKEKQKHIEDLRAEVQRLKLKPYKSPILPPISPMNMSTPPSIATTPPPSELPLDIHTRSIAMSLAKELNDAETMDQNMESKDIENELMIVIGEVLPLLIEGQINVNEAANTIISKFNTNRTEEQTEMSRNTIAEILSQITNQNIKLGEFEATKDFSIYDEEKKHITEFKNVIKGLVRSNITPKNVSDIDVAAEALMDTYPLIFQNIDIEEIVQSVYDDTNIEKEKIKDLVVTVTNCLSNKSKEIDEMSSTAADFLKQLQNNLSDNYSEDINSDNLVFNTTIKNTGSVLKKTQSTKKVSLCDLKLSPKSYNEPSSSNQ